MSPNMAVNRNLQRFALLAVLLSTSSSHGLLAESLTLAAHHRYPVGRMRTMAVARTTSSITGSNSLLQNEFVLRASIDDNDINKASSFSSPSEENLPSSNINSNNGIDVSQDPRLYKVRLSRATGIEWGTDLSFAFVYVRGLDPTGSAALSNAVEIGDQICESTPVAESTASTTTTTNALPVNLIGASFDTVMSTLAGLDQSIRELDLVFFRGSKQDLKAICTGTNVQSDPEFVTVTVIQNKGGETETIKQLRAAPGVNVRTLLVDNGFNVYQSLTRWTNCSGKQLCGTCIVNIPTGGVATNRKSMDEDSTLRENPDSYRLSCVTFAYGDITVETFPPINAAQWTR